MNQKLARFLPEALHWLLLLGPTATLAFAQTSSFGQAAQGIATEMIAIAKWVGIILCIICGHRPNGRRSRHGRQSLRSHPRTGVRSFCLAHHHVGAGALRRRHDQACRKSLK
jgi:cytochrome b561